MRQPKKKRENSQISAFTSSSSSLVGRAEQSRWHHYPEESEATASLTAKSNPGGSSSSEPSFVSRIENQTVSVGRDVILGCQVKNLGHNYKVSFAIKQTMFENHQKCLITNFLSNQSWPFFGFWKNCQNGLDLFTQYVNVARFARNVEWDFFCNFQTSWLYLDHFMLYSWDNTMRRSSSTLIDDVAKVFSGCL